jgi:hypothetical protein
VVDVAAAGRRVFGLRCSSSGALLRRLALLLPLLPCCRGGCRRCAAGQCKAEAVLVQPGLQLHGSARLHLAALAQILQCLAPVVALLLLLLLLLLGRLGLVPAASGCPLVVGPRRLCGSAAAPGTVLHARRPVAQPAAAPLAARPQPKVEPEGHRVEQPRLLHLQLQLPGAGHRAVPARLVEAKGQVQDLRGGGQLPVGQAVQKAGLVALLPPAGVGTMQGCGR